MRGLGHFTAVTPRERLLLQMGQQVHAHIAIVRIDGVDGIGDDQQFIAQRIVYRYARLVDLPDLLERFQVVDGDVLLVAFLAI